MIATEMYCYDLLLLSLSNVTLPSIGTKLFELSVNPWQILFEYLKEDSLLFSPDGISKIQV